MLSGFDMVKYGDSDFYLSEVEMMSETIGNEFGSTVFDTGHSFSVHVMSWATLEGKRAVARKRLY